MPSTVKVRIKAARNLVSSTAPSRGHHVGAPGVPLGGSVHRPPPSGQGSVSGLASPLAPRPGSGSASLVLPPLPDTAVSVTLGGHEAISEYDDDELDDMACPSERSSGVPSRLQGIMGGHGADEGGSGSGGGHQQHSEYRRGTVTSRCYSARTRTVRRAVHPAYGEEFRFDVADDTLLQDEPLLFHVWEVGASSSSGQSSVGCVYIDLNPLLMRTANLEKVEGEAPSAGMATPDAKNSAAGGGRDRALSGSIGNERESLEAAPPSLSLTPSSSMRDGVVSAGAHGGLEVDGWFPLYDTLGGFRGELGLSVKLNFIG